MTSSPPSRRRWSTVATDSKRLVLDTVLSAELNRLTDLLVPAAWSGPNYRDLTRRGCTPAPPTPRTFDVYRAYLRPGETVSAEAARGRRQGRRNGSPGFRSSRPRYAPSPICGLRTGELVVRFQQTCGPVMAKGIEDTAFYRYSRLLALNEVGGDPGRFGTSVEEFHAEPVSPRSQWPRTMTTLSTHDTKRSEDVRARLVLLSEDAKGWARRWPTSIALATKYTGPAGPRPGDAALHLPDPGRCVPHQRRASCAYLTKATREAKLHTSWLAPDGRSTRRSPPSSPES